MFVTAPALPVASLRLATNGGVGGTVAGACRERLVFNWIDSGTATLGGVTVATPNANTLLQS